MEDLIYTAITRCPCGGGLARRAGAPAWECSLVLLGSATREWHLGGAVHTRPMPIEHWPLAMENARTTTRPVSHAVSA